MNPMNFFRPPFRSGARKPAPARSFDALRAELQTRRAPRVLWGLALLGLVYVAVAVALPFTPLAFRFSLWFVWLALPLIGLLSFWTALCELLGWILPRPIGERTQQFLGFQVAGLLGLAVMTLNIPTEAPTGPVVLAGVLTAALALLVPALLPEWNWRRPLLVLLTVVIALRLLTVGSLHPGSFGSVLRYQEQRAVNWLTARAGDPSIRNPEADYQALLRSRLAGPESPVDPAREDWFFPNGTNAPRPLLWTRQLPDGSRSFYRQPGAGPEFHLRRPVTVELRQEWIAEKKARAELAERQQAALQQERQEEAERLQRENAAREAEAKARQAAEAARAAAAEQARQAAAERAREEQAAQAAQLERETRARQVAKRRLEEAVATPEQLQEFQWVELLSQVLPEGSLERLETTVFAEEFSGRRFRITGKVSPGQRPGTQQVVLEARSFPGLHCQAIVVLKEGDRAKVRPGQEQTFAGTCVDFTVSAQSTNLYGLSGRWITLNFANAEIVSPVDTQPAQAKRTGAPLQRVFARKSPPPSAPEPAPPHSSPTTTPSSGPANKEPFFTVQPFRDNPPIAGTIGFAFENSVRLIAAPFTLLNRATRGSGHEVAAAPQPEDPATGCDRTISPRNGFIRIKGLATCTLRAEGGQIESWSTTSNPRTFSLSRTRGTDGLETLVVKNRDRDPMELELVWAR